MSRVKKTLKKIFSKKKILISCIVLLLCAIGAIVYCNKTIENAVANKTYDEVAEIPYCQTALLLGTAPKLQNGQDNLYFTYRINAAVKLYKAGKIKYIIISGDNSRQDYNEPESMRQALIRQSVPKDFIYLDYAGFRTLDSVVRTREIFGQDSITVISQQFHNERAIYLAQEYGIHATGYNAQDVSKYYGFKTRLREYLARVKMFIDISMNKQPHFLGDKIEIK
ncbi:SanA/YdcF family protein [Bacteroides sp. UBA939]|uniref:SanA/YdcF family protein n=1 Tax=Bacteroides sp. UBA939 TaxID=1946092 RepID=UPI0025BEF506|nr:ElyC/SanA/YdcF family protein [Bacteroides sp. UBA939]